MRRRRVAALALLAALSLAPAAAHARDEGEAILLVIDPGAAGAANRVEAELVAAGFRVVVRSSKAEVDRAALLDDARAIDAIAAVRVHATASAGAELWVVDRVTGKTVLRDVAADHARDDATLATKTTELLRASLLEARMPAFHPAEVPVSAAVDTLIESEAPAPVAPPAAPPRGFVSVGGTVGAGGALGPLGFVDAELRVRLTRVLAVGAAFAIPVSQSTLDAPQGSSSQLVSHASLALDAAPFGFAPRLAPFAGITAGVLWFRATGTATAPYTSEVADVFSTLLGLRAGASLRLASALAVRAQIAGLAAFPQPSVTYAGKTIASLPDPLVEATLALELVAW
jgi:hypothetical protein